MLVHLCTKVYQPHMNMDECIWAPPQLRNCTLFTHKTSVELKVWFGNVSHFRKRIHFLCPSRHRYCAKGNRSCPLLCPLIETRKEKFRRKQNHHQAGNLLLLCLTLFPRLMIWLQSYCLNSPQVNLCEKTPQKKHPRWNQLQSLPEVIILLNEVMEKCYTFSPETPGPKSVVLPGDVPHFSKQPLNISVTFLQSL